MRNIILLLLLTTASIAYSQSTNSIMVSGAIDVLKTDYNGFFDKAQFGFEGHYFVVRHFAAGAGVEVWTDRPTSFVMGMRWYPNDFLFVRFRGLIGINDAAIGAGWSKPLSDKWRFEAMGDFYFDATEFGLRAGVSYLIK